MSAADDDLILAGTAHHEAGHAVAAVLLGRGLVSVSILPDDDTAGRVTLDALRPCASLIGRRRQIESEAIIALAGTAAERRYLGHGDNVPGSVRDRQHARELADRFAELAGGQPPASRDRLAWILAAHKRAEALVRQHWPAVQVLAADLMAAGELDGETARAIVLAARIAPA